jgi:branched-chain amino acid transport system permease protein
VDALSKSSRELAPSMGFAALRSLIAPSIAIVLAFLLHRYFASFAGPSGPFYAKVLLDIGIGIILAVSLNIVNGFTGQFSIGHAGFMLTGGYVAAAITFYGTILIWGDKQFHGGILSWTDDFATFSGPLFTGGDLLFLAGCLAGGLAAALAGYLVGLPSLRLRGDYLAIVTLGFGEIVRVFFQNSATQVTRIREVKETPIWKLAGAMGQSLGMTGIPFYTSLFWVFFFVAITLIVAYRIKLSSYGRALISIREDEIAAESMGVNTTRYKVRAFVIAAFFAGIAGALYAHLLGSINAGELGFMKSFDVVIMVVLGGMGSISGVVLAAIILTVLPEYLRAPTPIWLYALILAVIVLAIRRRHGFRAAAWIVGIAIIVELIRLGATAANVNLADFRMVIYALLLIVMMIVRPQGLFGIHEVWDFVRKSGPVRRKAVKP